MEVLPIIRDVALIVAAVVVIVASLMVVRVAGRADAVVRNLEVAGDIVKGVVSTAADIVPTVAKAKKAMNVGRAVLRFVSRLRRR